MSELVSASSSADVQPPKRPICESSQEHDNADHVATPEPKRRKHEARSNDVVIASIGMLSPEQEEEGGPVSRRQRQHPSTPGSSHTGRISPDGQFVAPSSSPDVPSQEKWHSIQTQLQTPPPSLSRPSASQPISDPREPPLCKEKQKVVDLALEGHNVFLTGSGGCGKSVLVRTLCRRLKAKGKMIYIVAPTGQAALQVNGMTTWSYADWHPDDMMKPIEQLIEKSFRRQVFRRLNHTDVLIIDEISMVENQHFDRLSRVMSAIRHRDDQRETGGPFGGVQVIVAGDFCQLPPVKPFEYCTECGEKMRRFKYNKYFCPTQMHREFQEEDKWAFRSDAWKMCDFQCIHLYQIHRQSDERFIGILQLVRLAGQLKDHDLKLLEEFNKLPDTDKTYTYFCLDKFECNDPDLSDKGRRNPDGSGHPFGNPLRALNEHRFYQSVELKINMPVVLLINLDIDGGLCNRSQGVICDSRPLDPSDTPPEPNPQNYEGDEEGYVRALWRWQQVKDFRETLYTGEKKWPVVQFHNGQIRTIIANCSISELGGKAPYSLLMRTQIPLAPGWAMTIHKSQSLSLDRLIVNLDRVFTEGQTSLRGLKIEGGDVLRSPLKVDSTIREFLYSCFPDLRHSTYPTRAPLRRKLWPPRGAPNGGQSSLSSQ
ncbi:Uu.00g083550.m01.CDS01 [Anthostomella pinea]|uniref:ATP-dependent DNA helicase n=1 Tax=Anthostomella pinea TaxID=933095 RepID=A0AAI8YH78_9PEZI|nr:Uu.00g083550.m01.CDS01 [Anthostomella pinea]